MSKIAQTLTRVVPSPTPDTTTGTGDANPEASPLPTENAGEIFYTVKFVDSITEEEIASQRRYDEIIKKHKEGQV